MCWPDAKFGPKKRRSIDNAADSFGASSDLSVIARRTADDVVFLEIDRMLQLVLGQVALDASLDGVRCR